MCAGVVRSGANDQGEKFRLHLHLPPNDSWTLCGVGTPILVSRFDTSIMATCGMETIEKSTITVGREGDPRGRVLSYYIA